MRDLEVCNDHGGRSPKALKARAQRDVDRVVAKATAVYAADPDAPIAHEGLEVQQDPIIVMGQLANAAAATMASIGRRVNYLSEEETSWISRDGNSQLNELVKAYERSLDRSMKFSEMLVKAGFAERQLQLDEFHAREFQTVLLAILKRLDISVEQARPVIVEELKAFGDRQRALIR